MKNNNKHFCFDKSLKIEAHYFKGCLPTFPEHLHDYYVIGYVEQGERKFNCKGNIYSLSKGSILLLNPNENHSCSEHCGEGLTYKSLNISTKTMLDLTREIMGKDYVVEFFKSVIIDENLGFIFNNVHNMIMENCEEFAKEEQFIFMMSEMIEKYSRYFKSPINEYEIEIKKVCDFIEENYSDKVTLDMLCEISELSKSTLIRVFTKTMEITPYKYLENVRINKAKKLIENGIAPIEAAISTGFSDQSHFNKYFTRFIGITPGGYREIFKNRKE